MPNRTPEEIDHTDLQVLKLQVAGLEQELLRLRKQNDEWEKRDRSRIYTALVVIGGALMSVIGWIFLDFRHNG